MQPLVSLRGKQEDLISYAAAAAKSLQSRPTLCDPIDGSPPGSPDPWDSPGKNTGVGCHFLLQCMKVKSESEVAQSCPTLSHPMDCSLPGSSVHGIFQARVLEWGVVAFSVDKLYCSRKSKNCYCIFLLQNDPPHFRLGPPHFRYGQFSSAPYLGSQNQNTEKCLEASCQRQPSKQQYQLTWRLNWQRKRG